LTGKLAQQQTSSFLTQHALTSVPGQQMFEPLLSWLHKRQASHTWNQTDLAGKLVRQEASKQNMIQTFDPACFNKRAGSKMVEPLFCILLVSC